MSAAISVGDLDFVKWIYNSGIFNFDEVCEAFATQEAGLLGHLEILKYFHENSFKIQDNFCCVPAARGMQDVWLQIS